MTRAFALGNAAKSGHKPTAKIHNTKGDKKMKEIAKSNGYIKVYATDYNEYREIALNALNVRQEMYNEMYRIYRTMSADDDETQLLIKSAVYAVLKTFADKL